MFKYVPVLRYKLAEITALKTIKFSDKILPLIEIIQHYPSGKIPKVAKKFDEVFINELNNIKTNIMVDIPMYVDIKNKNIEVKYKDFLSKFFTNVNKRIDYLQILNKYDNIIPVISYNPNTPYQKQYLTYQEKALRLSDRKPLGFRIFNNANYSIISEIKNIIKPNDILLLDIDINKIPNSYILDEIETLKKTLNLVSVIINAPIPHTVENKSIKNNCPVVGTDNSMIYKYNANYNFDAFGDYAGIKKDLLLKGFRGYITNIYYSYLNNAYIGFTAYPSQDSKTFKSIIAPTIISSKTWAEYSTLHHHTCTGCKRIYDISSIPIQGPGNSTNWKTIAIQHYIFTMNENL